MLINRIYRFCFAVMAIFLAAAAQNSVLATHIRAGDIVARSLGNPLQFEFTLVIFTDPSSGVLQNEATLYFGDGTSSTQPWIQNGYTLINPTTYRNEYRFVHQYNAPGYYTVEFNAENRNAGILNMNQSVSTSFYIRTEVYINPLAGPNITPRLGVPPLDKALRNQLFEHNPQAYDEEGDSLSYRLVVPRMSLACPNCPPQPMEVANYTSPADPVHNGQNLNGGPATFTIDTYTGLIEWNTPGRLGEYNIAFVVEEWRLIERGQPRLKMSVTTRDMQIIVEGDENRPPELTIPKDLCVLPGTFIQDTITVSDPDLDNVNPPGPIPGITVELFSPLAVAPDAGAVISFTPINDTTYLFTWNVPTCLDVRQQPYQFVFKATDNPPGATQQLIDFATWNITVVGPPPTNVTATPAGTNIALTWDPYSCPNGEYFKIYRRINPFPFIPDSCELGVPAYTGYVQIAQVPITETSFTDTNNGQGLEFCTNYSYILSVDYPLPGAGQSYASNEADTTLLFVIPVMTAVSVDSTSVTAGQIQVAWQPPAEFVPNLLYKYRMSLLRAEGTTPGPFTEIYFSDNAFTDSTYLDTNLDTENTTYHYKVQLLQSLEVNNDYQLAAESDPASSVRLAGTSGVKSASLTWTYNVPWNNSGNYHYIYREINGDFVLIDSVLVNGSQGQYTDTGAFGNLPLEEKKTYCYYVTTQGDYTCNPEPLKLLNNSQRVCVYIEDVSAPCNLVLTIDSVECETFTQLPPYTNSLRWRFDLLPPDCDTTDVAFYTVYYSPTSGAQPDSLTLTPDQFFNHQGLISLAGCYAVSATDSTGNRSPLSNVVCVDNCLFFSLPNIITPNGDGINDMFMPDPKSRFVKSLKITILNRWGKVIFENDRPDQFWGGKDESGKKVPHGIYFYYAEVEFFTLDPGVAKQTYKGWLEVVE